jgi:sugar lactone lactonase YvrE
MKPACPHIPVALALLFNGVVGGSALAAGLPIVTSLPAPAVQLKAPARVAVDTQSRLYVSDPLADRVVMLDAFGREMASRQGLGQPLGIAVDIGGRIYVGGARTSAVKVFDSQWTLIRQLGAGPGEFQLPGHIACATADNVTTVFVADGPAHLLKAYRDGLRVGQYGGFGIGLTQFNFPAGIWVSPDGLVFVVDQGNDRVQVLNQSGAFLRWFSLQAPPALASYSGRAQGITGDVEGRLYVADTFQGQVKVFDRSGTFLGIIGGHGENPGQLRSPGGMAMDGFNRLWVANANNGRLEGFGLGCFTQLSVSPAAQFVPVGATVQFTAAGGCPGDLAHQWLRNGTPLEDGGIVSGATNATLHLAGVTSADGGAYAVFLTDPAGTLLSPDAWLTVVSPPVLISSPASRTVAQGGSTIFNVNAQGSALEFQWMQNGIALAGASKNALTRTNLQPHAAGSYTVRISNPAGTVTSAPAILTVVSRPVITEFPMDQTAPVGSTVAISVTAVGSAPLAYQWFRNGGLLSGQTRNPLVLSNVTAAVNGVYLVRVSNSAGITNASAKFAVAASVALNSALTGAGNFVLTWNDPYYVLQAAPTLAGPWQVVSETSPFTVPAETVAETSTHYFRLLRR